MDNQTKIRKPAVAGFFYPRDPKKLADDVDRLLARAGTTETPGHIRVAVAPHAGYQYSGQVAAYSYRLLREQDFHTAVVVSPSHMEHFDFSSVYDGDGYETPLGMLKTGRDVAERLAAGGGSVKLSSRGHVQSHLARQEHAPAPARRPKKFTPPTIAELEDYRREKNLRLDPEQFVDFYESKGWMVGKTKMKDWKAAARNWARREIERHQQTTGGGGYTGMTSEFG